MDGESAHGAALKREGVKKKVLGHVEVIEQTQINIVSTYSSNYNTMMAGARTAKLT